ncbi:pectate lyase [Pedobacter sp. BS3]|uniref:pectate lyase n=1 Tax=Pedobacter sp. BS3 TaxID=2567937 RepID=UPI001F5C0616|nr:pectate lyase [Pedobacter sp. BS3]
MAAQFSYAQTTDPIAENMLVYQRSVGGWPKAVNNIKVDYNKPLTADEKQAIKADSLHEDATFDNKATSREINYLVTAYKKTGNKNYLAAAEKGINYILNAQYDNGGWPQFYPDKHLYRSEITYNDNAMINVLNILQDIVDKKHDYDVVNPAFVPKAKAAVAKGIDCILKTQIAVNGKLTAWCAQYDKDSLKPAKARAFELPSIASGESVGIVQFLMRQKNPSPEIKKSIESAMAWFEKSKIPGYKFEIIKDASQPTGKDGIVVADPNSVTWARFYDIDTNKPQFVGRDSKPKETLAEIENERRAGYAWYGTWPQKLFDKDYPKWLATNAK